MNILILIFSFLAVFALSTSSFWQLATLITKETSSFCGFLKANRGAENTLHRKLYNELPSLDPKKTIRARKPSSKKKTALYTSHRLQQPPHQYARLQLAALWKEEDPSFVKMAFARLLHELYGHTPWFTEAALKGDVEFLIEVIMNFGKKQEPPFAIHELFSTLQTTQADLLYKMVKGTHTYSLEDKRGFPPLLDFVSFSFGSIKQTCRFSFASLPLLRALFDEDTVHKIMTLENTKWEKDHKRHTCTKEELLVFLQHNVLSPTHPSFLDTYFYFGMQGKAHDTTTARDPATGIHTAKKI